jgi:hypothetical protein
MVADRNVRPTKACQPSPPPVFIRQCAGQRDSRVSLGFGDEAVVKGVLQRVNHLGVGVQIKQDSDAVAFLVNDILDGLVAGQRFGFRHGSSKDCSTFNLLPSSPRVKGI